jgi:hypothetical protein
MDLSTSAATRSSVTACEVPGSPHTACTAARSAPPANTDIRAKSSLLGLVQQPVRTSRSRRRDSGGGLRGARGPGEQAPVVEPLGDLGGAHRPRARGGQLDAERQAVEPLADLGDDPAVGVEVGTGGPARSTKSVRGVRRRQRRDRPDLLAVDAERLPARRQHDDPGALLDDAPGQPGGTVQHVLAVVQHEQQRPRGEVLDDRLLDRRGVPLLHLQRGGGRRVPRSRPRRGGQLGDPRAVGEPVDLAARHLDREPRLPHAADPRPA